MLIDEVTYRIIGAAMSVHSALGPGLVEKAYETCMSNTLNEAGLQFERQTKLPVRFHGTTMPVHFRVDFIVAIHLIERSCSRT